jgi:hypothetical protein
VNKISLQNRDDQVYEPYALRWTAAGMLEAERQFRKIIGYRDATLVIAIERDADRRRTPKPRTPGPRRPLSSQRGNDHTGTAATKFHGARDILVERAPVTADSAPKGCAEPVDQ